jgi:tetratricopeptide (TPR) repeat protein
MRKDPNMDEVFLSNLTEIILANLGNEDFGVKELVHESGMSRSRLTKKLHEITNKNINQFIREIRLLKALEMLQKESLTASEVAFKAGFSSPSYFNTCFHDHFGYPPGKAKENALNLRQEDNYNQIGAEKDEKTPFLHLNNFSITVLVILSALIVIVTILVLPKAFKRELPKDLRSSDGRISLAVMPFLNMNDDTTINNRQDWIQEILTDYLSNNPEDLEVRQAESVRNLIQRKGFKDYASITPSVAAIISRRLDTKVFIYGNIKIAGTVVRLNARIIDSRNEEVIQSFQVDGFSREEEIFSLIDTLSARITDYLILSKLTSENPHYQFLASTRSPKAYKYYINGNSAFYKRDFPSAVEWFLMAVDADSNFVGAMSKLSYSYYNQTKYEEAKKWCRRAYLKKNLVPIPQIIYLNLLNANLFEPPDEEIKYAKQMLALDDQLPTMFYRIGVSYNNMHQYSRAIPEFEKALEINKIWGLRPDWVLIYIQLGIAYHETGQYKKEKKLYKKAEHDFPDDTGLIFQRQAILSLTEGDITRADRYIEKYIIVSKITSLSEAGIESGVASIYSQAGFSEKAEEYYRKALSLEPESTVRQYNLAFFLIDKERNINEGLDIADKALDSGPDNYSFLACKGWGLYKLSKYKEAIELLEKSWNLKPVYIHSLYLRIEEVKKALANHK